MKNKCPSDEKKRTKENIKMVNFKNGEKLTELYLNSDVFLLACVFKKFIKVSVNQFDINPLYCVSLPGYIWQFGLKNRGINLQTLQNKDLLLTLENNIRGGISSVMGDRYVKSHGKKKMIFMDATNLSGHSVIQPLPYDETKMWHGHPDLHMNCLEEI